MKKFNVVELKNGAHSPKWRVSFDTEEEALKCLKDTIEDYLVNSDSFNYYDDEIIAQFVVDGDFDSSFYSEAGWYKCSNNELELSVSDLNDWGIEYAYSDTANASQFKIEEEEEEEEVADDND